MESRESHGPGGRLKLLIVRQHGDITIGFDGYSRHTHGDAVRCTSVEFAFARVMLHNMLVEIGVIQTSGFHGTAIDESPMRGAH